MAKTNNYRKYGCSESVAERAHHFSAIQHFAIHFRWIARDNFSNERIDFYDGM